LSVLCKAAPMCVCVFVCVCMYVYIYVYVYICIYIYIYSEQVIYYTNTRMGGLWTRGHIKRDALTEYIYIYIHIHTHTHTLSVVR